jgi:hypothetical protein
MRIECASNTVNAFTRTSKRLRFPLLTWKYLHFLYMQKIVLLLMTEVIDVFIDLNKGTVYLSSELFPFFCMYIVLPFSPFLLFFYSSILNSPRFHAHCYLPSFCLSHASPGSHFFSFTPLFLFLCAMCTTFSSILNFPHTRSVDHNCLEQGCTA